MKQSQSSASLECVQRKKTLPDFSLYNFLLLTTRQSATSLVRKTPDFKKQLFSVHPLQLGGFQTQSWKSAQENQQPPDRRRSSSADGSSWPKRTTQRSAALGLPQLPFLAGNASSRSSALGTELEESVLPSCLSSGLEEVVRLPPPPLHWEHPPHLGLRRSIHFLRPQLASNPCCRKMF